MYIALVGSTYFLGVEHPRVFGCGPVFGLVDGDARGRQLARQFIDEVRDVLEFLFEEARAFLRFLLVVFSLGHGARAFLKVLFYFFFLGHKEGAVIVLVLGHEEGVAMILFVTLLSRGGRNKLGVVLVGVAGFHLDGVVGHLDATEQVSKTLDMVRMD